jgi:tetratricopeptide (TPR) repeat protein
VRAEFLMLKLPERVARKTEKALVQAESDVTRCLELDPYYAHGRALRAQFLQLQGKPDEALEECQKANDLREREILAWLVRGVIELQRENKHDATRFFRKACSLDPSFADAFYWAGKVEHQEGKYDDALKLYERAIELDPRHSLVYSNRGAIYVHKEKSEEALDDFNQAIFLNPDLFAAYFNRAGLRRDQKQFDLATKDFTKALELNETYTPGYFQRGLNYYASKQLDLAIEDFTAALACDSFEQDRLNSLGMRGLIYAQQEKWALTVEDLEAFCEKAPPLHKQWRLCKSTLDQAKEALRKAGGG